MRRVSIVASRPKEWKLGSALIMYFLDTDYSHVSWVFWSSDEKRRFYYEAVLAGGVQFRGQRYWDAEHEIVFQKDFDLPSFEFDMFLDEAMSRCGEKYALLQNVGIQVAKWFGLARNIFSNGNLASNCSELIYIFKGVARLELQADQDLVTPKHIVEACRHL